MTMTTEDEIRITLIALVREQARVRDHKLDPRQLARLESQTMASIRAMSAYLDGRPLRQDVEPVSPLSIAAQVERATQAARDAAARPRDPGLGPFGRPASREEIDERLNTEAEEKDQAHQRWVRENKPSTFMTDEQEAATRPHMRVPEADRVQAEGYILHDGTLYKIVRAIYGSGNLYAKKLDLQQGEFVIAKGMMSYLRESERINEAQAAEFGSKLEVTPEMGIYGKCLLCGRPLTDEESIRNKVGPGPHKNA